MLSTRATAHSQDDHAPQPRTGTSTSETMSDRRRRWSLLLRLQHYQPIIVEVLDEELPKYEHSTIINVTDRVSLMRECALILTSAPSVFAAAVDGNLVSRFLADTDLQREYEGVQARAHEQPSIYIHLLADVDGIPPTPNQYLIIRELINDYLVDGPASEQAAQIDNITPQRVRNESSKPGYRKYLQTKSRSLKRVEVLHIFCQGIQNRWLETPAALRDTPFEFPPGECGYSQNSHVRLAQHRAHRSSNYVMNLVEDICTYLHRSGRFTQHFTMHQFIIYLIFRPTQAAIAEIFCSSLLQVWTENGGGFNAYPAGRSVASARRMSVDDWRTHENWVKHASPVAENMRAQKDFADEWSEALDWEHVVTDDVEMADSGGGEMGMDDDGYDDMYSNSPF